MPLTESEARERSYVAALEELRYVMDERNALAEENRRLKADVERMTTEFTEATEAFAALSTQHDGFLADENRELRFQDVYNRQRLDERIARIRELEGENDRLWEYLANEVRFTTLPEWMRDTIMARMGADEEGE